jgi:hypothetical protein
MSKIEKFALGCIVVGILLVANGIYSLSKTASNFDKTYDTCIETRLKSQNILDLSIQEELALRDLCTTVAWDNL